MNRQKLIDTMIEKGCSKNEMCEYLVISRSAFFRKLKGTSEFTLCEIKAIANKLELSVEQIQDIFFN